MFNKDHRYDSQRTELGTNYPDKSTATLEDAKSAQLAANLHTTLRRHQIVI